MFLPAITCSHLESLNKEGIQTPMSVLQVKYGKSLIGGASHPATFVRVYDICGPTYPGEYEPKTRTYTLHYPGLAFLFPIPAQHAEACSENHIGMPLEFPDGSTPLASRICIYAASEGAQRLVLFTGGFCSADHPAKIGDLATYQVWKHIHHAWSLPAVKFCQLFAPCIRLYWSRGRWQMKPSRMLSILAGLHAGQGTASVSCQVKSHVTSLYLPCSHNRCGGSGCCASSSCREPVQRGGGGAGA